MRCEEGVRIDGHYDRLEGGHLTINKGGRREVGGGGRGEAMMTDDGDRSNASPLSGVICIRR